MYKCIINVKTNKTFKLNKSESVLVQSMFSFFFYIHYNLHTIEILSQKQDLRSKSHLGFMQLRILLSMLKTFTINLFFLLTVKKR